MRRNVWSSSEQAHFFKHKINSARESDLIVAPQTGIATLANRNVKTTKKKRRGRRERIAADGNVRRAKTIKRVAARDLCYEHLRERTRAPGRLHKGPLCDCDVARLILLAVRGVALKRPTLSALALA